MTRQNDLTVFEMARPRLLGLAYRLLGSAADAEDAVQDTYLRWQAADRLAITSPAAWLTTACTNRCLDILKSASRKRMDYIGPWLPEPLQTETVQSPEEQFELASSLTTAFLLLLERLTPKERAAYLLREVFGSSYKDVAEALHLKEATCRQLVSRASRLVGQGKMRSMPTVERQKQLLSAFEDAISTGSLTSLSALLTEDIQLHSDGGGKAKAALRVIDGTKHVGQFVVNVLSPAWSGLRLEWTELNGSLGLTAFDGTAIVASLSFGYDDQERIAQIFITRNPDKLRRLGIRFRHEAQTGYLVRD
jgi:RNA polymerase sigma factor (sigma-70 family)